MNIKNLQPEDLLLSNKLVKRFKKIEPNDNVLHAFLSSKNNILIGAFDDEIPVGILIGYKLARPDMEKPMYYIHDIDVDENYRRKGIATKMFGLFKQEAVENNFLKIFIITNKTNLAAVGLYRNLGGSTPNDDDIVFVWK